MIMCGESGSGRGGNRLPLLPPLLLLLLMFRLAGLGLMVGGSEGSGAFLACLCTTGESREVSYQSPLGTAAALAGPAAFFLAASAREMRGSSEDVEVFSEEWTEEGIEELTEEGTEECEEWWTAGWGKEAGCDSCRTTVALRSGCTSTVDLVARRGGRSDEALRGGRSEDALRGGRSVSVFLCVTLWCCGSAWLLLLLLPPRWLVARSGCSSAP